MAGSPKHPGGLARLSIFALMVPTAFASVLVAVLLLWPYAPYSVYGVSLLPRVACPGQDVEARVDFSIESGAVRKIEAESSWRHVADEDVPESGGTGVVLSPPRTPRQTIVSPIVREAPEEPGEYRLYTITDVAGTFEEGNLFHGFPKFQRSRYESSDTLTVLPEDDPRCAGASDGGRG